MNDIVNLTPHAVVILGRTIESTGVARCSVTTKTVGVRYCLPIVTAQYGEVEGLPAPVPGTAFIVSRLVAAACPNRKDLLVPADLVRDDAGRVIGCNALEAPNGWEVAQ
jgi:hypothetical protein